MLDRLLILLCYNACRERIGVIKWNRSRRKEREYIMNWTTNGPNGPNNKSKTVVFNQNKMTSTQKKKIFKWGTIFFFIFLLLLMIPFIFNFLTNYIWMESLGFESVYTTTLITKISLVVAGFLLFFIFTYLTLAGMQKLLSIRLVRQSLSNKLDRKKWLHGRISSFPF